LTWLWAQYEQVAISAAVAFWAWVLWRVVLAFVHNWRDAAAKLCGSLALLSAILALLWAAHLSDKYLGH